MTAFCNALQSGQASSGEGRIIGSSSDLIAASDDTNHFISLSVLAGLFLITSATGYYWFWRRARKLTEEVGLGESPIGGLPVTYGYLIAGLAVVSLLVFVPLTADNIFRAIAPGVNETSGHAEGIRNLVTFVVLSGLSALILGYHLRYLRLLRASHPAANVDSLPEASQPPPET